jgi:hypothetical protein
VHSRHLTPAHHLRGAARNSDLSAKVGQMLVRSKAMAAPRLVHALVRRHIATRCSMTRYG